MGLVNITPIEDGTSATANSINEPIGKLAGEINGNLDSSNLANNAVTRSKLAPQSVTSDKLNFTKSIDDNGWTVYDYGTWKVFKKKGSISFTIGGNQWGTNPANNINLPVGIATIGDNFIEVALGCSDAAITSTPDIRSTNTSIGIAIQNKYTASVTNEINYSISVTN